MFEKLEQIVIRFETVEAQLADPDVAADRERYAKLMREHSDLSELVATYLEKKQALAELTEARAMSQDSDTEMREMAVSEVKQLEIRCEILDERLKLLLVPKDPRDQRNAILEIRAGTGGEEAALFGGDLMRMYIRYFEERGYKIETLSLQSGTKGGVKECSLLVAGKDVFGRLKHEGGVHRVQRVPETESQGRIHTSAVTVAVLPEAEEVDIQIADNELRVDVYRSSGPGGQSVNTTDSAVRLTHLPSGLVVICQDEKSQHKNKAKALKILRSRLLEQEEQKHHDARAADRKAMVGSGDRSERVRTYNFPQGRITDHRIGLTLYSLESFLAGNMDDVLDPLHAHYQAELLRQEQDS
jgi:peptide chain release factor 1